MSRTNKDPQPKHNEAREEHGEPRIDEDDIEQDEARMPTKATNDEDEDEGEDEDDEDEDAEDIDLDDLSAMEGPDA